MKLEASQGGWRAAHAERAFVQAVQKLLPEEAFRELEHLETPETPDPNQLVTWAVRWHVHAPCILDEAQSWARGFRGDRFCAPSVPAAWQERLQELRAPPASIGPYVELRPVISEEEEKRQRKRLAEDRIRANGDPVFEVNARNAERFWDEQVPRLRAEEAARSKEAALRPIAANPARESQAEFMQRARLHWDAMVDEAKRCGIVFETRAPGESPELKQALMWLVQYQLHGHTYKTIADTATPTVMADAIRKKVERLARLLRLELRMRPKGRPRVRIPGNRNSDN